MKDKTDQVLEGLNFTISNLNTIIFPQERQRTIKIIVFRLTWIQYAFVILYHTTALV